MPTARVARVWRYPVKSMLGQQAPGIDVTDAGVIGDRRFAVRDASGRLGSGKGSGRFRRIEGLIHCRARYEDEIALVTLPDGRELRADDPDIDATLSELFGQSVRLERTDDGSHLDAGPLHLLTTASLAWLERTLPEAVSDERRFRPNLVLAVPGAEPVEQQWLGTRLRIGNGVELRVTDATERCGMIALEQEELPRDPAILRHITRNADLLFGVYAEVLQPGRVAVGDEVTIETAD